MAIRKLYGTATLGGAVFWEEIASHEGWRVQYNKTLDVASPLNPYRLLDPRGHLWASADDPSELSEALPELIDEFSRRTPLLSDEKARDLLIEALRVALKIAIKRLG